MHFVKITTLVFIMLVFLSALSCFAATRHYYIAAEDVAWDYAPSGHDLLMGSPIRQPWSLKARWPKSRFIEYTDTTFAVRKTQPEWLGILGPIIRAEVGDEIIVEFLNRSRNIHDIHPHGLRYDKDNEGAVYLPFGAGARVPPGGRYTYHWFADRGSGPGPGQPSSVVWWYHPHVDTGAEINAGLLGPIVVTAKGKARADGSPKDVDREFVTCFMIFDELRGKPEGQFYAINGYIFGNLPGLAMKQGEKVRWYLLGMGNEIDVHTPHWHGETVMNGNRNTDVVELLPGSMVTVDMFADNPGTWMFHCHVADHMEGGMMAVYTIVAPPTRSCPVQFPAGDFWNTPEKFSIAVKNLSGKPIKSFILTSEILLTPQDLRRPYDAEWTFTKLIRPGETERLEKAGIRAASAQSVLAWIVFPYSITYEDGKTWRSQKEGECMNVFWRDKDHPEMLALPPRQIEMNPD